MRGVAVALIAAAFFSFAAAARAGQTGVEQQVSFHLLPGCVLTKPATGGDFLFPDASALSAGTVTTTAELSYRCTAGANPSLSLSDADGGSGFVFKMHGAAKHANTISFNIYLGRDVTGVKLADSSASLIPLYDDAAGASLPINFFASVSVPGNLPADTYADTINATLSF
jgi:spore coat protein U-like protein